MEKSKMIYRLTAPGIYFFVLLFSFSGFAQSKVDPGNITKEAERKIGAYYSELFKIKTDNNGMVSIDGMVNTLFDKLRIGELIAQVDGVRGINNNIMVDVEQIPDAEIKDNIENEFQLNNVILEPEKIIVKVDHGTVSISGTVSYFREKLMAQSIASWQEGVIDLKSDIKVLPYKNAVSDDNLKSLIGDIINKHFSLEKNIAFNVENGIVVISGSATSLYAKDHIQEEIMHLLGVKNVINSLGLLPS